MGWGWTVAMRASSSAREVGNPSVCSSTSPFPMGCANRWPMRSPGHRTWRYIERGLLAEDIQCFQQVQVWGRPKKVGANISRKLIHGCPGLPQASIDDGEKDKIAAIYMASSPVAKRFLPPTRLSTAYIHSAFGWRFDARPRWNLLDSPFNISTAFVWPDGCPGYAADGSTDLAIV